MRIIDIKNNKKQITKIIGVNRLIILIKKIYQKDLMNLKHTYYQLSKFTIGSYGGNISITVKL